MGSQRGGGKFDHLVLDPRVDREEVSSPQGFL